MSAKCRDLSLPAVLVDSEEAEAPAAIDPSRVAAMVAAVENFKDDDHESGRFLGQKTPPSGLGGAGLLPSKIEQGQEEEVDAHAGEMVLELGCLAHILGIAKGDGGVAKETSCNPS